MSRRIIILGAPGAGKTTLGARLASRLSVPCHSTDPIAYLDERWTPRAPGERQRLVAAIVAQPGWVAEGGHLGWTALLLTAADQIIWLDPPWWTIMWRVARRYIIRWRQRRPSWIALRDLRALVVEGWFWAGRYYWQPYRPSMDLTDDRNLSRAATKAALAPYAAKVWRNRASRVSGRRLARIVEQGGGAESAEDVSPDTL